MESTQPEQISQAKRAMPIGWILAVLAVMLVWAGAYALRGGGTKEVLPGWADGMSAGMQIAEESDKPMLVLFTAGWCPPCQELKKDVLTKAEVHDALQAGFVPVQMDLTDQSASNPNVAVAQQFGVQGIPTVVLTSPRGEPIEAYPMPRTGPDPAHFSAWLERLSQ